jgi:hypothetical protein
MNLVADEGIDREIVDRLRQGGHRVSYVAEMEPGLSDDEVLTLASREASLLLTSDRDFGELVFRQHRLTFKRRFGGHPVDRGNAYRNPHSHRAHHRIAGQR